jgi:hypothetical protein
MFPSGNNMRFSKPFKGANMTDENNGGNRIEELREHYKKQLEDARKEVQRMSTVAYRLEGALLALEEMEKNEGGE